jgi:putative acetyltransferase
VRIRGETSSDLAAIRGVHRAAFGQEAEGGLVDALRADGEFVLSLVAEDPEVVGHILFSRLPLVGDVEIRAAALAPMGVLPGRQRQGIGSALVREGLLRLPALGVEAVVVLGHLEYYPRFGFSSALARRIEAPWSGDPLMALEFRAGAIPARVRADYPRAILNLP